MRIKIYKYVFQNGDYCFDIDNSHSPYSKITEEYEQTIEIDENKWEKTKND